MQSSIEGPPGAPEVSWKCHKCGEKVFGTKICPKCGASKPSYAPMEFRLPFSV